MKRKLLLLARRFSSHTGSEGPHHDPYHYEEVTLTETWKNERGVVATREVVIHMGLAEWFKINGERFDAFQEEMHELFKKLTGWSIDTVMEYAKLADEPKKCDVCHTTAMHKFMGSGYVGEGMYSCKCGEEWYCEPVTDAMIA